MKKIFILIFFIALLYCEDSPASTCSADTITGSNEFYNAAEPAEKEISKAITINFGISYPFHGAVFDLLINPKLEVLLYNRKFENSIMSIGLGFQYGNHIWIEEYAYLADVNGEPWPTRGAYSWHLNFYSLSMPVYFTIPLSNVFFETIVPGFSLGRNFRNNLSEKLIHDVEDERLNKTYLNLNIGIKKNLYKNMVSIIPSLGRMNYLTENNTWQKGYFFSELTLQVKLQ